MIGAVNAEVFSPIAQRLKRESPFKATMMATLTNGAARSGYIPDDASYGKYTFEVLSSRLRPGCAESSIVNGLLELIDSGTEGRGEENHETSPRVDRVARACSHWQCVALAGAQTPAREVDRSQIPIDADDIAGVVTSARGPEAGVWVIAETTDTPTKFRKIVVTDDQGRYLLPDLPAKAPRTRSGCEAMASSIRRQSARRRADASRSPRPWRPIARAAAQIYPANYWYSLIDIPPEKEFPGTGPSGNGIARRWRTQHHWINQIKANCNVCHQLGQPGDARDSRGAWHVRVERRGVGPPRAGRAGRRRHEPAVTVLGRARGLEMFADWTDRIAARRGAARAAAPAGTRAQSRADDVGLGRPGDVRARRADHGQTQSDRQRLRPDLRRRLGQRRVPHARSAGAHGDRDADSGARSENAAGQAAVDAGAVAVLGRPSCTGSTRPSPTTRRWTAKGASGCRRGSACPRTSRRSAATIRPRRSRRSRRASGRFSIFDPRTRQFKQVNICFDTHHVQFANDKDETLYGNGRSAARSAGSTRASSTRPATSARRRAGVVRISTSIRTARSIAPSIARSKWACSTASFRIRPTAASGARCPARCRARSSASIRRPASAKPTSRRSIRRPASSATRRAASTSTRTA